MAIQPTTLRFGDFEIDPGSRQLRRSGVKVRLTPQAFRTLSMLVSRAGDAVTRDELRQALWPGDTHVEFERGINFCILQVRQALGDSARAPRFVETLPRIGYRFLAPVQEAGEAPPPRRRRFGSAARWCAASFLLGLALLSGGGLRQRPSLDVRDLDPPARDAYLRGLSLMRSGARGSWEEAALSLESSVTRHPDFAPAQAALAEVLLWLGEAGVAPARDVMPRARAAARAALDADPERADAWVSLAAVRLYYDWDWGAEADIDRALAVDPGSARAHGAKAALLSARGDHDAAIASAARAVSLDPLCPTVRGDLGWYYYCARRFDDAAEEWRHAVAVQGANGPQDRLVDAFRHLGRPRDAWRAARETMRRAEAPGADELERRGPAAAVAGFLAGAARYLEARGAAPSRLAALRAAIGQDDAALDLLERAARERAPGLLRALAVDPDFDRLRGLPRYVRLLDQLGLRASEPPRFGFLTTF